MHQRLPADKRIAEIEEFFRFAQVEWPTLRSQAEVDLTPRCRSCINSELYSPLENGVCGECRAEAQHRTLARQEVPSSTGEAKEDLDALLTSYEGKGERHYDALVLFSGGKDSTYLLYRLRKDHPGLRLLAVTLDNGFASTVALANVRRVLDLMDSVDGEVFRPRASLFRKAFRYALTHPNPPGEYPLADRFDGDLTFDICRNIAAARQIPLMIAGVSGAQMQRIFGFQGFESPRSLELTERKEVAGRNLRKVFSAEEMRFWWNGSAWSPAQVPRVIYPIAAWEYDEQSIQTELVELGLLEKGQTNPLVTNNDLIPLLLALDVVRQGYTDFEPEFGALVRAGKTDRTIWLNIFEAIEYSVKNGRFVPRCLQDTATRLGLRLSELGLPTPS
jgi:hypothetical protein